MGIIGNQVQVLNGPATVNGERKPRPLKKFGKVVGAKNHESGDLPTVLAHYLPSEERQCR